MSYVENEEGNGTPLQYSCLENSMDGGAWWAIVHGVAKSRTRLSDFHFHFLSLDFFFMVTVNVIRYRDKHFTVLIFN